MILFLADFPKHEDRMDGFAQRILAIDQHFQNEERTYIGLSLRKNWIPRIHRSDKCKIIRVQFITGFPLVLFEAIRCKIIYVHAVSSALRAFYILPWRPFVIDVHGVVPEEFLFSGYTYWAIIYGWIESLCLKFALARICVTKQMGKHLNEKYPNHKSKTIIIPILQSKITQQIEASNRRSEDGLLKVVYSGGVQQWQNIDLMIDSMVTVRELFVFEIYTPAVEAFRAKLDRLGVPCRIESLSRNALCERYKRVAFGFLLRDPILVNKVACPTKLIEYMQYGVIPIVLQPEIGDMNELGYSYITLLDFCRGKIPTEDQMETMRKKNRVIIESWEETFEGGLKELIAIVQSRS